MTSTWSFTAFKRRIALILTLMTFSACGGGTASPSGPTATGSVTVNGSVVGSSSSASSSALGVTALSGSPAVPSRLMISVASNPALSTAVGADGTFTLSGLPSGTFSLVFTRDGVEVGMITFSSVLPNQELTITVSVNGSSLVLVQDQRSDHGGLELEGKIQQVLVLNAAGDSRFLIGARTVVVRSGVTSIRHGNTTLLLADLAVGLTVHVKGTALPLEGTLQPILASEVNLQNEDDQGEDDDGGGPTPRPSPRPTPTPHAACMIEDASPGRRVDLGGRIASGDPTGFRLLADHVSSPVDVVVGTASVDCTKSGEGEGVLTSAQCRAMVVPGARVDVTGTVQSCTATSALVSASRLTVRF